MLAKKLKYSSIIFLLFLLILETGLRVAYFQVKADSPLAIITAVRTAEDYYVRKLANLLKGKQNLPPNIYDSLWTAKGARVLKKFSEAYEKDFSRLVKETEAVGSKLIVLYIPSGKSWEENRALEYCRDFFQALARSYGVDFCDVTDDFLRYPIEAVTFIPLDGHMSRFGNKLVAQRLADFILKYDSYRSGYKFTERPKMFGDLIPNDNDIVVWRPSVLPFRITTNSQGLRSSRDVVFPKQKQRVLLLGDSNTFGVYLDNYHTYSEILNRKFEDKEFFNAARCGYTISDELTLFVERARYIEPDITVLQVLDNDLYGLFYFNLNSYSRNERNFEPSEIEREFIEELRQSQPTEK